MNDIVAWIMVGVSVAIVVFERALRIYSNFAWRRNGRDRRKLDNPGVEHTPGAAEPCQKHGKSLAEIKNELVNIRRRLTRLEK